MVAQVFAFAKASDDASSTTDSKPQPIDPVSSHLNKSINSNSYFE
jgi:hypothetical protein